MTLPFCSCQNPPLKVPSLLLLENEGVLGAQICSARPSLELLSASIQLARLFEAPCDWGPFPESCTWGPPPDPHYHPGLGCCSSTSFPSSFLSFETGPGMLCVRCSHTFGCNCLISLAMLRTGWAKFHLISACKRLIRQGQSDSTEVKAFALHIVDLGSSPGIL